VLTARGGGEEGEAVAVGVEAAGGGRLVAAGQGAGHVEQGVGVVGVQVGDRPAGALADRVGGVLGGVVVHGRVKEAETQPNSLSPGAG
jgi:hypothetical protein